MKGAASDGEARPLQARAQRTRASLLAAGAQEFSARGFSAATSRSIAQRAGAATGSFYQYFANKEELLRELARERFVAVQAHSKAVLPTPSRKDALPAVRAALVSIVDLVMALHRDDPGLHEVLTERRHIDGELDAITSAFERTLVRRIERWLEIWGVSGDRQASAFVLFCSLEGAVHNQVLGQALVSDARFKAALVQALTRMVGPSANSTDVD